MAKTSGVKDLLFIYTKVLLICVFTGALIAVLISNSNAKHRFADIILERQDALVDYTYYYDEILAQSNQHIFSKNDWTYNNTYALILLDELIDIDLSLKDNAYSTSTRKYADILIEIDNKRVEVHNILTDNIEETSRMTSYLALNTQSNKCFKELTLNDENAAGTARSINFCLKQLKIQEGLSEEYKDINAYDNARIDYWKTSYNFYKTLDADYKDNLVRKNSIVEKLKEGAELQISTLRDPLNDPMIKSLEEEIRVLDSELDNLLNNYF